MCYSFAVLKKKKSLYVERKEQDDFFSDLERT